MPDKHDRLNRGEALLVSWQRQLLGGSAQVYLLDDTGPHQITDNTGWDNYTGHWTLDPQTCFVATQYGNKGHLYLYGVGGSRIRELAANGRVKAGLNLSPDGRYLAYWEHPVQGGGGLILLDWQDDRRTVVQDTNRLIDKVWAADSQSLVGIVWAVDEIPTWYRYGLDGRELERRPLPHFQGAYELTLSPDWQRMAYAHLDESDESRLLIAKLDGAESHRLGLLNDMESPPVWSPDGERIAWVGMRDGDGLSDNFRLFVADANGSNVRKLMVLDEADDSGEFYPGHPVWSSDSRKLAISSFVENPGGKIADGSSAGSAVFVADVNTGEARQVSDAAGVIFHLDWRPGEADDQDSLVG
jgi:TolB protein